MPFAIDIQPLGSSQNILQIYCQGGSFFAKNLCLTIQWGNADSIIGTMSFSAIKLIIIIKLFYLLKK